MSNFKAQTLFSPLISLFILTAAFYIPLPLIQQKAEGGIAPNDRLVRLENSLFLYQNENPGFRILFGDSKNPGRPKVLYQLTGKDAKEVSFALSKALTGDGQEITPSFISAPSLETVILPPDKKQKPKLIYREIIPGVNFNYEISEGRGVKEEITINNQQSVSINQFIFDGQTSAGVKAEKRDDGRWYFTDQNGNYLFHFEKPYMMDAKGARSEAVTIEINNKSQIINHKQILNFNQNDFAFGILNFSNWDLFGISKPIKYEIIISADPAWLADPSRAYPVMIDPSVTHNADANFTGAKNRVFDADTGGTVQLESYYQELPADRSTIGLWHMNENSANTCSGGVNDVCDASGNGNDGAFNGNATHTTSSKLGASATTYDGVGDFIKLPSGSQWQFTGAFSVEAWIYPTGSGGSGDVIIGDYYIGGVSTSPDWNLIYTTTAVSFRRGSYIASTPTGSVPENQWSHIALVRDGGSSNNVHIYVNGVEQATGTFTTTVGRGLNLWIGIDGNETTESYSGRIDEVRISNIARTPEEIMADAQRRPYGVYTSQVIDAAGAAAWDTMSWSESGVQTGDGETLQDSTSLIAQWNFNETSGTTAAVAAGSCGSSCNGTLTSFASTASQDQAGGTGWTANNRRWGAGALMFDGSNDYVTCTDANCGGTSKLDIGSGQWSAEAWIKTTQTNDTTIVAKEQSGDFSWELHLNTITAGKANFSLYQPITGSPYIRVTSVASVNDGNWHHIVGTWDPTGTSLKIYIDGKLDAVSTATSGSLNTDTAGPFKVGFSTGRNYFNGAIDSIRIYSRALTAAEILANYQAGNIEFQTRTGTDSTPDDGSWEAWKPVTSETQIASMDSDSANWSADNNNPASGGITKANDSTTKIEGTGSLKLQLGAPQVDANTRGLWHLEETSGNANDSGSLSNALTANSSPGSSDGFYGKARTFNGSTQYFSCTDAACGGTSKLDLNSASPGGWSFGARFKVATDQNGWIVAKTTSGAGYGVYYNAANDKVETMGGVSTCDNNTAVLSSTNTVNDGKWHSVVVTWSAANPATITLYLDGVLQTSTSGHYYCDVTDNFSVGSDNGVDYFSGAIDEPFVTAATLSAEEIAEAYRAGRDHRLTKIITSTDLSAKTKLPFYVAADRPGTYMEATVGESSLLNMFGGDTDLKGYWPLDENSTGAAAVTRNDYSGNGNNLTDNATVTSNQGKIGKAGQFTAANSEYLSIADNAALSTGDIDYTIVGWMYLDSKSSFRFLASKSNAGGGLREFQLFYRNDTDRFNFQVHDGTNLIGNATADNFGSPSTATWYFVVAWHDSVNNQVGIQINDGAANTAATTGLPADTAAAFMIGSRGDLDSFMDGRIDEVMFIKRVLSADERRQMFEIGRRTHPITIDFVSSPQAAYTSGTSVTINNPYGTTNLTDTLSVGDTIIFKENVGGTETVGQATVTAITNTSSAYGTVTVNTAPSFPSGGYTTNATVFKWQREYWDITGPMDGQIDASARITLRVTDGNEGRTVWLDDFRSGGPYLTTASGSTITSAANRYFQYRAIFTATDRAIAPYLTSVTVNYTPLVRFPPIIGVSGGGFLSF